MARIERLRRWSAANWFLPAAAVLFAIALLVARATPWAVEGAMMETVLLFDFCVSLPLLYALCYARTLPLRVGDQYRLTRYFKESGNPVILRVVRKETVTVPAGRFNTVVVQPSIRTSGLFAEGGRAEIYFTDDERHIPVLIKSRVPVVGSLTMSLKAYRAGN